MNDMESSEVDSMLHEAMASSRRPIDAQPSFSDVRRRARRRNRRHMTVMAGAIACTGVATTALIIRRDAGGPSVAGESDSTALGDMPATTMPGGFPGAPSTFPTTTAAFAQVTVDASLVWDALANLPNDPTAAGFASPPADVDRGQMPTAAMFGCDTEACAAMFNYVVWHELARAIGFFDIEPMQGYNPDVDFSQLPREGEVLQMPGATPPQTSADDATSTTFAMFQGVILIDGGAPAGAVEDAYQRLSGYDRTIVAGTGKSAEHTMVMPIRDELLAASVNAVFGIGGFDAWDQSWVADPVAGSVAVVIGPDYWTLVQNAPPPPTSATTSTSSTTTTTTSTTVPATTSTP